MTADQGYCALKESCAALVWERDVVRVSGPDAERYLQGQLSQDVGALAPGAWAWALALAPQGKLDAFVRLYRLGADEFLLDTDAGMGAPLVERLLRFRLRTKADVQQLEWLVVAVRGPAAGRPPEPGGGGPGHAEAARSGSGASAPVVGVPFAWPGWSGYDLLGPQPRLPEGVEVASRPAYEAARIEAGFPVHGAELDERTIPAEAGLVDAAVSFTKGCYTGQELVARIDSRGSNVPRHLRGLVLSGPAAPGARLHRRPAPAPAGHELAAAAERSAAERSAGTAAEGSDDPGGAAGKEVGRLTSVARSPGLGWVALGYVGRAVPPGETLLVGAGSPAEAGVGAVEAQVRLLPLTSTGP